MQKRTKKIVIGSVLAAILAAVLLIAFMIASFPKKVAEVSLPDVVEPKENREYFRMLVAGSDATTGLCDVLMLVSIDLSAHEVFVLQIPRDTYAEYTEKSYRKLNGARASLGGMEAFAEFLSGALGVSIDRTLHLSPAAFRTIIDELGGEEIELPRDLDYDDPAQNLSIHLKAGPQTLGGVEAEQFVRYRADYAQGDLDRIDAQKLFLSALFEKVSQMGVLRASALALRLRGEVDTDIDVGDVLPLAKELFSISPERVHFVTAPGEAMTASQSGASYYVLSAPAMNELLSTYFGGEDGGFDPEGVFLNEKYSAFGKIYGKYCEYSLQSCG